jgi:MFS family permease
MVERADNDSSSTWRAMGRALRHRNYRLFFAGQGTSLIGTWLTRVAMSWLVYRLTHSAWVLGVVGFTGQLPTFLFSPLAGVLVDRFDRHRVLLVTQVAAMLQSVLLAWFTLRGTIGVPHIVVLAIFQGVVNAFDVPARQSFVIEMVEDRDDLANAIALNSTMVNAARLLGPAAAAVLIGAVGEGWCFAIDAVSYLAVVASLLAMRLAPREVVRRGGRIGGELSEGVRYVLSSPPIRSILLLLALVSFAGVPTMVLMPIFAVHVPGGGPHTLGMLMASSGVGAVIGVLWLAARRSVVGLGRVLCVASIVFGASLIAFSLSSSLSLLAFFLALGGGGMMLHMAASNTLLQTIVDEDKRGRVMSFYAMSFFGMVPFGNLLSGWLGARIGAPATVLAGGVLTLLGGFVFWTGLPALRRHIRPIYQRLGIVPAIADGLHHAAAKHE